MSFARGHRRTRTQAEINVLEACKVMLPQEIVSCSATTKIETTDKPITSSITQSSYNVCQCIYPLAAKTNNDNALPTKLNPNKIASEKESSEATKLREYRFPSPSIITPVISLSPTADIPTIAKEKLVSVEENPSGKGSMMMVKENKLSQSEQIDQPAKPVTHDVKSACINSKKDVKNFVNISDEKPVLPVNKNLDIVSREQVTKGMLTKLNIGRNRRRFTEVYGSNDTENTLNKSVVLRNEYNCRNGGNMPYVDRTKLKVFRLKLWEPILGPTLVS